MLYCNLSSDDLPWHWVINEDEDSAVHFIGSIIYLSLLGWEMRGHQNNDIKAGELISRAWNKGYLKVHEDFKITEKAPACLLLD